MIKIRDLEYLLAIAEHKHFGRAAQACHVSQPTLSGQIIKLEEQLGLQLLERHRRGILLTPAGETLVADAQKVLAAAGAFEHHAAALKDPLSGARHIGLIPTLAPYLLPHIMRPLVAALPKIDFFLYEKRTAELLDGLDAGSLDMLVLPWLDEMSGFERYDLFDEELLLAVHRDSDTAKQASVSLASLRGQAVLNLEDGHCLRDQALDFCSQAGGKDDERFQATSLETLRHMVASNMGITLLPKLATMHSIAADTLAYIPFSEPVPHREIVLLTRPNYTRVESVEKMVGVIKKAMQRVLP
ncbi:MAG: DNA-binding transcriptional regulator OxyR [Gammaproteobacteria bacterium]|nr:DNA-binding transcriptional regulator OxyR [Gammaproteobacteria bacterium]NND39830.1 DNA-binding transcriptional regulator OxyR [Pseudomonadales bacterium]MBT8150980.1 DNA-binding transcriptional regulator OxyR [Gammaproteobacteria bacterium]NNL11333.1 DNA-binding transcriptional regulator OxyR [Pseudomonadales bacterium]NNM11164.1 DNA-binding transcriptional regulator OxyR [Pseudomonadales bacterium]